MRVSSGPAARGWCAAGLLAFGPLSCGGEPAGDRLEAPTLSFVTDSALPAFGGVAVAPIDGHVLADLSRSGPTAAEWNRILVLRAGDSTGLAMLGSHEVAGDTLRFRPRFRPAPGMTYYARYDGNALNARLGRAVTVDAVIDGQWSRAMDRGVATTAVQTVYPSPDVLPMNLLRMYVHFSAPMTTGRSYDFIRLYADGDSLVDEPFFTAGGAVELWNPDKTRLTILFDPGRIKRDLRPNEELGLPLRRGMRYRLVIDSAWPDANGRPLVRGFEKRFRVGDPDRRLVRAGSWAIRTPRAATRDSLVLDFPEPLDHGLLQRLLTIRDASGTSVAGEIAIGRRETRWVFVPRTPWSPTEHAIDVDTELEDLAGNSLRKLFDVQPGDSSGVDSAHVRLRFVPRR